MLGDLWQFPFLVTAWGTPAEWFAGLASFAAVAVALWQSIVISNQAKDEATKAGDRFKEELNAANERTIHEVNAAEQRSRQELEAANQRHAAEMEQQRKLAQIQRVHLREQEFKLALIRVSKAQSAYTHELATLLSETQLIIGLATRQERDDAIKPIAKKMNLASHDLALEVAGAHMLTNNDQIHSSMDPILMAATEATTAANEYENTIIMAGQTPDAVPIYMAMEKLNRAVGDARRLAGEVLVTGWDD